MYIFHRLFTEPVLKFECVSNENICVHVAWVWGWVAVMSGIRGWVRPSKLWLLGRNLLIQILKKKMEVLHYPMKSSQERYSKFIFLVNTCNSTTYCVLQNIENIHGLPSSKITAVILGLQIYKFLLDIYEKIVVVIKCSWDPS